MNLLWTEPGLMLQQKRFEQNDWKT